jgi:gliding motility-associated-like protein
MRQKLIIRCPDLPKAACMPEVINFSTIPFQANFDTAGFVPIASQGHLVPMPYMANVTHANDQEIDLCEGDSIALHPTITGDNYRWSTSVKTNTIMVYDSGYYTVRAITPCETQYETFHVHVIPTKPLITPGDTTICTANDSKIKLTVSHNTSNTIWNTGETTDSIMAYNTGLYYVSVSNQCGTFSDSVYITFDTGCRCMPFIPTAFTPNGDGLNDAIEIKTPCMEQHMSMHIYNRFGQEVYHIYQSGQKWDGTINGHPAPSGVYYYTLEFKPRAGTPLFKKGDITLIR